jgi:hypothetical protein
MTHEQIEMKQSSIEWLISQQKHNKLFDIETIEQAKAMHKEEIIDAFEKGCDIGHDIGSNHDYHEGHNQGYDYYNETFNTKEK